MLFVFPNWQSNITGLVGESWYRGALFHHVEAGFANAVDRGGNWLWGFSPLMAQYKFLSPHRKWAPNILLAHDMRFESFLFYNFYILD